MKKIVIYSKGKLFEQYNNQIKWECIVAIVDKKAGADEEYKGIPVILPSQLAQIDYDFVAIFSMAYFVQIKMQLTGEYQIPFEKIISWRVLVPDRQHDNVHLALQCIQIAQEKGFNCFYDCGMGEMNGHDQTMLYKQDEFRKRLEQYDAVLVWDRFRLIRELCLCGAKYIIAVTQFDYNWGYSIPETRRVLKQYGETASYVTQEGIIWVVDAQRKKLQNKSAAIYVVTHKNYNVLNDDLYKPVCVGGYRKPGFLSEGQGTNIAYLNEKINEMTALYWIWKNTNTEFVGLNHYRRYFYNDKIINDGNYLNYERLVELLKEYDIIFPNCITVESTLLTQIKDSISEDAYREGLQIIKKCLRKNQPEYIESFDMIMNGNKGYMCNLFVTKRNILNAYCEWLFSFLIEAAEAIDISGFDSYSKRVIGFFAERMWTVWVSRQDIKIKELPFVSWPQ